MNDRFRPGWADSLAGADDAITGLPGSHRPMWLKSTAAAGARPSRLVARRPPARVMASAAVGAVSRCLGTRPHRLPAERPRARKALLGQGSCWHSEAELWPTAVQSHWLMFHHERPGTVALEAHDSEGGRVPAPTGQEKRSGTSRESWSQQRLEREPVEETARLPS